jgi:TolB protein
MRSLKYSIWVLIMGLMTFFTTPASAALDIEITRGVVRSIPIAIVPFDVNNPNNPNDIARIISNDLNHSGQFQVMPQSRLPQQPHDADAVSADLWKTLGLDDLVIGSATLTDNGQTKADMTLLDLFHSNQSTPTVLMRQSYTVANSQTRALAHHISDIIYEKLTGEKGVFSTRLAYVTVEPLPNNPRHKRYSLMISDVDGHNAKPLLTSTQPIMSPDWSPDGRSVAYVSFETKLPQIFTSDVATGQRRLISSFAGINGAPSFSPDSRSLAVALSMGRTNPNIYIIDLGSGRLTQLTDDAAINTEPSWAPDGQSLLFTSDRGGAPQIYSIDLAGRQVHRVTYLGAYNASAMYLPGSSTKISLLHRDDRGFNIAIYDLQSGTMQTLTQGGYIESPSPAPNGRMIVYSTNVGGRRMLGMVSSNGQVNIRLPEVSGDAQAPAWSPY